MSRYMERTNFSLRNLRTLYIAYQDGFPVMSWADLAHRYGIPFEEGMSISDLLDQLIFDSEADFSLSNNIFRARENARSAQDHITRELWQSLNDYYHLMRDTYLRDQLEKDPIYVFDLLIRQAMLYYGVIDSSMNRGEAFMFLHIGKLIERGTQIVSLLKRQIEVARYSVTRPGEDQSWRYLLISLNGYETYIQEHVGTLDPKSILEQIIFKYNFPNSIFYTWRQIERYNGLMAMDGINLHNKDLNFIIGKSFSFVQYTALPLDIDHQLEFLDHIETDYFSLAKVLNKEYFRIIN